MEKNSTYTIEGMTCQGCVKRVQAALGPFAETVTVSLEPPRAVLTHPTGHLVDLQKALSSSHYRIHESTKMTSTTPSWLATYSPLLLILAYIGLTSVLVQIPSGTVSYEETMRYFMAGFFLVFSFFKLLDIQSFAQAYAGYDLFAARWHTWGLIYPFVELALGVAYLVGWQPVWVNLLTLIVMGFSAIGVIRAVMNKQNIRCACLGSVFQLPMSTVTIIEDLGMAAMAGLMLIKAV